MLLATPLNATMSGVRERTPYRRYYHSGKIANGTTTRIDIDRGALHGIFAGMRLYSGDWRAVVVEARPEQAVATLSWGSGDQGPVTGTVFSSRSPAQTRPH